MSYPSFILCLALAGLSLTFAPTSSYALETHRYLEHSGDESHYFDWILSGSKDCLELRAVASFEEHRTIMDKDLATRQWSLSNPKEKTALDARREGDYIVLKGLFKGDPLDKRLDIDEAPWFQSLSTSLRAFLESPDRSTVFWTLRPDKLTALKVRATKKGADLLDLGNRKVETQRIEVGLTGVGSLFARGNYWFRASDRLFLHYQGPRLPGIPLTTITLEPRRDSYE